MILGIGSDIIEVERIEALLSRYKDRFLQRIFTPYEQAYCFRYRNPAPHLAGRFAAKEAVAKALGTGLSQNLTFLDIEIGREASGKPIVLLSSTAREAFSNPQLFITISHCRHYATAYAVWVDAKDQTDNRPVP